MKAKYILTSFSPSMFGEGATAHIKPIRKEEAQSYVSETTQVVATRVSHERLAHVELPGGSSEPKRYAQLSPGTSAIHIHYRGPSIGEDGIVPFNGMVTFYLIEAEEYQEHEE